MLLPIFQDDSQQFMQLQSRWSTILTPIINIPLNSGLLLTGVELVIGANVVNHMLGRQMKGWIIADQDAVATIYRSAAFNSVNLTLTSSAVVTVNIWVF